VISNIFPRFGQNLRKVNWLEVNGKIFQICLKTVITRFLGMFDHLEKVSINSEECLFCEPWSVQGTNAKILTKNRQNSRKVNRLEFNWKIFQISLETVISRFLGLFDHLEKVLKISDECLFCEPWSVQGTNAKIRPKSPQIGGRKIQKVTSIKYIVNKYIIIYYYILLYITL
jgi:hypothetical protein